MLDQLEGAGFPAEIIEAYKGGGTPWLDFRHTVFGPELAIDNAPRKLNNSRLNSSSKLSP